MKFKEFMRKFLAGIAIGVGAAIPGVSGAAIAVVFKVYEAIIWSINNIFKKFLRAIAILIPVLIGICVAVIPCVYLFDKALESFVFGVICIFAGFLIGSFPGITDEVKGVKPNGKHKFAIAVGMIFVIALGVLSVIFGDAIDLNSHFDEMPVWMYFALIPVGLLAAVALTVPGLSGSLIMLVIGFYKPLLSHTVDWVKECLVNGNWNNFPKLIGMLGTFAIGAILGVALVSKLMKILLTKHHNGTYFTIIGFIIGSVLVLFFNYNIYAYYQVWSGAEIDGIKPWLKPYIEIPIGMGLLILSIIGSYLLVTKTRKQKQLSEEEALH